MGGGNAASLVLFAGKIDLKDLTLIYGRIGNHTTAPTAVRRWTDVTAIAIWHEQEQMMDIGGMVTIFVAMGESRGKYIEN